MKLARVWRGNQNPNAVHEWRMKDITVHCRILNIGADSEAYRLLQELAQSEPLIRMQHQEMGSVALEHLLNLPESELPHLVLIPFRSPIVTSLEFTSAMHSHEQLRSVPI